MPPTVSVPPVPSVTFPPLAPPPESEPMTALKPFTSSAAPATFARLTAEFGPSGPPAIVGTKAILSLTDAGVKTVEAPARMVPPLIVVAPEYVLPVPKVSADEPDATAGVESVTVVGVSAVITVPGAMPEPVTACPTASPEVLAIVTVAVPFSVPVAVTMPPETCSVPAPNFTRLPAPPLIGLLMLKVPVPF